MPLYEYRCADCGESFELLRRMQDADRDLACPRCQSKRIERLLSSFSSVGSHSAPSCRPAGRGFV